MGTYSWEIPEQWWEVLLDTLLHTKESAPGPDGISYSAWRLLPEVSVDAMMGYFFDIMAGTALPAMQVGVWIPKAQMGPEADTFRPWHAQHHRRVGWRSNCLSGHESYSTYNAPERSQWNSVNFSWWSCLRCAIWGRFPYFISFGVETTP